MLNSKRSRILLAAGIAGIYITLAVLLAVTLRPRSDEGFFASPALNLVETGSMGTPVLEPGHAFMKDIDRYTYWITPLHFLAQAAWYKVFGFGLVAMRMLSAAWALVALAAWFLILRHLSRNESLALLGTALIGLDYNFIVGGASGRMDMMAASLGLAAFAAYWLLREQRLAAALVIANALVCAAGLTHPVAGYLYFAGLLLLVVLYDRTRIRPRQVALALVPYLAGAAAWGWYILQDPRAFVAQFTTNATMLGRLNGVSAPWMGFVREITARYRMTFGLGRHSYGHEGPVYLKSLILLAFVVGLVGAISTGEIRRNKGYRTLMLLAALIFVLLSIFDGQKAYYYLIHIFPFYAALTAIWIHHLWQRRTALRPVLAVGVAGVLVLQIAGVVYLAMRQTYARTYAPAIAFLRSTVGPGHTIMGSASLGFGLRFPRTLVDDVRLGCLTGRKPDYIVVNEEYTQVFRDYSRREPQIYEFIVSRLTQEYEPIYNRAGYQVYAIRGVREAQPTSPPAASAAAIESLSRIR
ncbi:MAG TPA: glycosyltransferase family 39 protein [Bryobacteraceae bacterium]|nr:glycosyltransferase family 39 protein [Bryobacteraceae bacterium]